MALAIYVKEQPKIYRQPPKPVLPKKSERFFYGAILSIGLLSIVFALWPLLTWQLKILPKLTYNISVTPIPQGQVLSISSTLAANIQVVKDADGFSYFTTDYKPPGQKPKEFLLTIPKINIKQAKTAVDSLQFDKHLAHFPGSALPGEVGNSFITGHSVLPQFNDPKNYRAIFTKLSDLEIGDEILVEVEGRKLHFVVQYAKIVDPHDLSVLSPIFPNGRNLTLMTCVPPGTNIKRLVVITSLI